MESVLHLLLPAPSLCVRGHVHHACLFSVAAPHPALRAKAVTALAEIPLAKKSNVSVSQASCLLMGASMERSSATGSCLLGTLICARALASPQDTAPDLMPDESTMWGARYDSLRSLAACPNSTTDFAMLAQLVSTPSACKTPHSSNFFQDEGRAGARTRTHLSTVATGAPSSFRRIFCLCFRPENSGGDGDYALMTRQSKKLRWVA